MAILSPLPNVLALPTWKWDFHTNSSLQTFPTRPNLPLSHPQRITATNTPVSVRPQGAEWGTQTRSRYSCCADTFIFFPPTLPPARHLPFRHSGRAHHSHPTLNVFPQVGTSVPTHALIIQSLELLIFLFTTFCTNRTQTYSGIVYTQGSTLELTTHILTFFHTKWFKNSCLHSLSSNLTPVSFLNLCNEVSVAPPSIRSASLKSHGDPVCRKI